MATTGTRAEQAGWREAEISYLQQYRVVCALCGQLVPGRYWSAQVGGEELAFCNPDHAERYVTYWLPRHGREAQSR